MEIAIIADKLEKLFSHDQSHLLADVIVAAYDESQRNLVHAKDFNELKRIVKELAEAQKRTEVKVEELAEAQKRTEVKVEELAEAQKKTETKLGNLVDTVRELTVEIRDTRREVGGLAHSMGYSLENEGFRALPAYLQEHYGIELFERLIRTELEGEEINILGKGKRNGREVLVVGEAALRLDKKNKFAQLENKMKVVSKSYPGLEVIPIMITHYATQEILQRAQEEGVIVVQSFQWA